MSLEKFKRVIDSAENGPLLIVLQFVHPVSIIRNVIFANKTLHRVSFYMLDRKLFKWKRIHLKPLFGKKHICENLTIKIVSSLNLRFLPSGMGGGEFDTVTFASKRGFLELLQIECEKYREGNITPSKNLLEVFSRKVLEKKSENVETHKKIFHQLLSNFPTVDISENTLRALREILDVKSFQIIRDKRRNTSKAFQETTWDRFVNRLLSQKMKSESDKMKRIEIYKLLTYPISKDEKDRYLFCKNFRLRDTVHKIANLDKGILEVVFSTPVPHNLLGGSMLMTHNSNLLVEYLMERNFLDFVSRILETHLRSLQYVGGQQQQSLLQPTKFTLYHTIRPSPKMIPYLLLHRLDEDVLLDQYISLIRSDQKIQNEERRFPLDRARIGVPLEDIFMEIEEEEEEEEEVERRYYYSSRRRRRRNKPLMKELEVVKKYTTKILHILRSEVFDIRADTFSRFLPHFVSKDSDDVSPLLEPFVKNLSPGDVSTFIHRSVLVRPSRSSEKFEMGEKNISKILKMLIDHHCNEIQLIYDLIDNNRLEEFRYFLNLEAAIDLFFRDHERKISHSRRREEKSREIIRKVLIHCLKQKRESFRDLLLETARKYHLPILDHELFQYAFIDSKKPSYYYSSYSPARKNTSSGQDEFLRLLIKGKYLSLMYKECNRARVILFSLRSNSITDASLDAKKKGKEEEEEHEGEEEEEEASKKNIPLYELYFRALFRPDSTQLGGHFKVTDDILLEMINLVGENPKLPFKTFSTLVKPSEFHSYEPTKLHFFSKILSSTTPKKEEMDPWTKSTGFKKDGRKNMTQVQFVRYIISTLIETGKWKRFYSLLIPSESISSFFEENESQHYVMTCTTCKSLLDPTKANAKTYFCTKCSLPKYFCRETFMNGVYSSHELENLEVPKEFPNVFCKECVSETDDNVDLSWGQAVTLPCHICRKQDCLDRHTYPLRTMSDSTEDHSEDDDQMIFM